MNYISRATLLLLQLCALSVAFMTPSLLKEVRRLQALEIAPEGLFSSKSRNWFIDGIGKVSGVLQDALVSGSQRSRSTRNKGDKNNKTINGVVTRTAARAYDKGSSIPSSRGYTTRKDARPILAVNKAGVSGDYNHYRTTALRGTPDRAVSILTSDSMQQVKSMFPTSQDGDLGENISVNGLLYNTLEPGSRFIIGKKVVVEITEPIEPCANLCTLPYINDSDADPKSRVQTCQNFLETLGRRDGIRGWYAKVLEEGFVRVGDEVKKIGI